MIRVFRLGFKVLLLIALFASTAYAEKLRADYTVKLASIDKQLFHITTEIKNIKSDHIDLSLPIWTPGWYTIENYAKNMLRFQATSTRGQRLAHRMVHKQTWRINTAGHSAIKVEFDYQAKVLALNQAKIARDYAFFTGIQLFLQVEGHRDSPSTVKFELPQGWKIVTALKETADPFTFTAPDYDTLVDAPTQMGNFDVTRFEAEGKPHYFVSTPAGAFSQAKTDKFIELMKRVITAQRAIFGDLPYEKYVCFYFFAKAESNAGGALEHNNSYVAFSPPGNFAQPERLIGTASHEFFHLWNVKRIRPAEMWPYNYARENETPLLWVAEGFTNYYGALALLRAGIKDREEFLQDVANAMTGVENNEARAYISPADASISTWLGYDTPVAFKISYYTQGQNIGALLDLSIRHDSGGRAGLDDVMRALYRDHYLKNRGFTTEELIEKISRTAGRDYREFFDRFIFGVEVPDYAKIFGYAGYVPERQVTTVPDIDFEVRFVQDGELEVSYTEPGSRLKLGDRLISIDGIESKNNGAEFFNKLQQKIGSTVKLVLSRNGSEMTVELPVKARELGYYRLTSVARPSADQLKLREGWLSRIN